MSSFCLLNLDYFWIYFENNNKKMNIFTKKEGSAKKRNYQIVVCNELAMCCHKSFLQDLERLKLCNNSLN
jgi:hypothetical protein